MDDQRITAEGVVVIKAKAQRTQERNRADALDRLAELVRAAAAPPKKRIPTRPSRAAKRRRLDEKTRRGETKRLRSKPKRRDCD
jgi:ribosome-associated protein